jgi:hypothetical protein
MGFVPAWVAAIASIRLLDKLRNNPKVFRSAYEALVYAAEIG